MSRLINEALTTLPAPDGTPIGNLRHTLAAFAGSNGDDYVLRATSNVYPAGQVGVRVTSSHGSTVTGLTLSDLRQILAVLEQRT